MTVEHFPCDDLVDRALIDINGQPVVVVTGTSLHSDTAITLHPPSGRIEFTAAGAKNATPPQKPRTFSPDKRP